MRELEKVWKGESCLETSSRDNKSNTSRENKLLCEAALTPHCLQLKANISMLTCWSGAGTIQDVLLLGPELAIKLASELQFPVNSTLHWTQKLPTATNIWLLSSVVSVQSAFTPVSAENTGGYPLQAGSHRLWSKHNDNASVWFMLLILLKSGVIWM